MNDGELIDLMADIWVKHGGDTMGFHYCYGEIANAIDRKLKNGMDKEKYGAII